MTNHAQNFLTIQKGAFSALVLPQNVAKVEAALAKLEKPSKRDPFKRSRYDNARNFPRFVSGMSTGEYVSLYNAANHGLKLTDTINANDYPRPAAEYAPGVPLCVEDGNPDYNPADDIAPAKTKRPGITLAELKRRVKDLGAAIENGDPQAIADHWLSIKPLIGG